MNPAPTTKIGPNCGDSRISVVGATFMAPCFDGPVTPPLLSTPVPLGASCAYRRASIFCVRTHNQEEVRMSAKSVETSRRLGCAAGIALMLMLLGIGSPAQAQPFDAWLVLTGNPTHGFVRVPANAALNP